MSERGREREDDGLFTHRVHTGWTGERFELIEHDKRISTAAAAASSSVCCWTFNHRRHPALGWVVLFWLALFFLFCSDVYCHPVGISIFSPPPVERVGEGVGGWIWGSGSVGQVMWGEVIVGTGTFVEVHARFLRWLLEFRQREAHLSALIYYYWVWCYGCGDGSIREMKWKKIKIWIVFSSYERKTCIYTQFTHHWCPSVIWCLQHPERPLIFHIFKKWRRSGTTIMSSILFNLNDTLIYSTTRMYEWVHVRRLISFSVWCLRKQPLSTRTPFFSAPMVILYGGGGDLSRLSELQTSRL